MFNLNNDRSSSFWYRKDASNLDGGGSSTFIIRSKAGFEENRFAIRNWPYDNGGVERAVANGLLVVTDN